MINVIKISFDSTKRKKREKTSASFATDYIILQASVSLHLKPIISKFMRYTYNHFDLI